MKPLFADTSFFIAFLFDGDEGHLEAVKQAGGLRRNMVTTRWVIAEVGNFLRKRAQRDRFKPFAQRLNANSRVEVLSADDKSFDAGLELYAARPDKDWSFIDCISFAVMRERGLSDALTADHHFQQAGFNALMR